MSDRIFFSYSRYDSAFALKLANDLRNAGATIWLDQLDIPPGKHWDSEIEEALNNSNCLLAILSPKSMLSNNAMDEISYALEENKKVIPILLTDTETPFRLRRLQRVDFTGDYDIAFRQLLTAIDIEIAQVGTVASINPDKTPSSESVSDNSLIEQKERDQKELSHWAKTRSLNTIAGYQEYLRTTSSNEHKDEAGYYSNKLETGSLTSLETGPEKKSIPGSKKKTLLITVCLAVLAAFGFAAFFIMNKQQEIKDTTQTTNQISKTAVDTKDSITKKSYDTVMKTIAPASTPVNIEPVKKETGTQEGGEALKEIKNKPELKVKQTEIKPQQIDTVQRVTRPDSTPVLPKKDEVKIEEVAKPSLPSSSPSSSPATTPVLVNSDVMLELKLNESPDMDKGRKEQPVTFSVTKNVIINGTTIIREGAIANGRIIVGLRFIGLKIHQVAGANGKMIPLKSKESDLKKKEVKKDNIYFAIIKKGTQLSY
jgi:hypothetical protein